jgi:predicted esterase
MITIRRMKFGLPVAAVWVASLLLSACGSAPKPTVTPVPPTRAPTPVPTLSLDQTSADELDISDFAALHSPVAGDSNKFLILGNVPVSMRAPDLPARLAAFLGRWEGYFGGTPVKHDRKVVLVVQDITPLGGTAVGWSGTNLQFPDANRVIHFRVVQGETPAIEWQVTWPGNVQEFDKFMYDPAKNELVGWSTFFGTSGPMGTHELTRSQTFFVYKDYGQYLAGKRIYSKPYQSADAHRYGDGYLLYLPDGYEADTQKAWPLIFFLHGYGDRGDNILVLAKASPFMYIRDQGPLPFIIAAPLLRASDGYTTFPVLYMDAALQEVQANYRVDPKRIYVTGLSMGGEGTWRFALHQPGLFAAIAPLSAYLDHADVARMKPIQTLPVWAIHGADDTVVPLARGQQPVDALKAAGGNIQFTVLAGHDHDVWTDTYSDPKFYAWLLSHKKP